MNQKESAFLKARGEEAALNDQPIKMEEPLWGASESADIGLSSTISVVADLSAESLGDRWEPAINGLASEDYHLTSGEQTASKELRKGELYEILGQINGPQQCPVCTNTGLNILCIGSKELAKHIKSVHTSVDVTWICGGCKRKSPSIQSWRCHVPKCKGPKPIEVHMFQCGVCTMSFPTKSGLSQHERHVHHNIRNEKRQQESERPRKKAGRRGSVWSEEELNKLEELDRIHTGTRHINAKLAEHFPNHTRKQISDARRRFMNKSQNNVIGNVTTSTDVDIEEEGGDLPLGEGRNLQCATISIDSTHPNLDGDELVNEWKQRLKHAICEKEDELGDWEHWVNDLTKIIERGSEARTLDGMYGALIEKLAKKNEQEKLDRSRNNKRAPSKKSRRQRKSRITRREKRRFEYARCQMLWENCPRKIAEIVWENDKSIIENRKLPQSKIVEEYYKEVWGVEGPPVDPFERQCDVQQIKDYFAPITASEVAERIKRIKASSATGSDKVTRRDMTGRVKYLILAKLYNSLWLMDYYPEAWKENRTTLLPKPGRDLGQVKNWRPITISSMVSRVFSGIMDSRLRKCIRQSERQKGFIEENGCYSNIKLIEAAIEEAKKNGGVFSIMDVKRAFDTIPHSAISISLKRKGIPARVAEYIQRMYKGAYTIITTGDGRVRVELKRGVKQGDPLSPLIFNLVIEPLIERLKEIRGVRICEHNLSVLAFADDITCIAENTVAAREQLSITSEYLKKLGMELSIEKCSTFEYKVRSKTWFINNPKLNIDGKAIPFIEPSEAFKYLGANIAPWGGLTKTAELSFIKELIERARALPMKPNQKIELLMTYIMPRFIYGLIVATPSRGVLKEIDNLVRSKVKETLHLPAQISSNFLYTPKRSGGLGILRVETNVLIAALRNGLKAQSSRDAMMSAMMRSDKKQRELSAYAKALGLQWPATIKQIDAAKERVKKQHAQGWEGQKWQGQGAEEFLKGDICNRWLTHNGILSQSRYIAAIKMRTNTCMTRAMMKKIDNRVNANCRKCGRAEETLGHILGRCSFTKRERIKRHDDIKRLLRDQLARTQEVLEEPEVSIQGEKFKPDLVIRSTNGHLTIIDVTVRYERNNYLEAGRKEKINKYKKLIEPLKNELNGISGEVLPIVVGSRGAVPKETKKALERLKIAKRHWLTISMMAHRSSIEIVNEFMDD